MNPRKIRINFRIISKVIGLLLYIEVFFLLLSAGISWYYHEDQINVFLTTAGITFGIASCCYLLGWNAEKELCKCDGMFIVTLSWITFSAFGALPYYYSGYFPTYSDCYFETMSGFTTTGATILTDVECLPHSILFWRALTHWLGGMGIVVFTVALLPLFKAGGTQLFMAEATGPTLVKIHPRIADTAQRLWIIYFLLTAAEVTLLSVSGMSIFDAICHSFATLSSGGFSTKNSSLAFWKDTPIIQYIVILFMILSGINFALLYYLLKGKFKKLTENDEFRYYIYIILTTTLFFTGYLYYTDYGNLEQSFRDSFFQITSIITTTGFGSADYMLWPTLLWVLLLYAMVCGGSAGSTNGGVKVIRVLIATKNIWNEFKSVIHPNAVIPLRMNGTIVHKQVISNVLVFLMTYLVLLLLSIPLLIIAGLPFEESIGAAISALGNIGPAIGDLGPTCNYANITISAKWILILLMLIGRLEIFTVLLLFTPSFWKK